MAALVWTALLVASWSGCCQGESKERVPGGVVYVPEVDVFGTYYFMQHGLQFDQQGYFDLPNALKVIFEVGTNRQTDFEAEMKAEPETMVFGFEPHPKTYAEFNFKHERYFLFNAAISPLPGFLPLSISDLDQCDSLLRINSQLLTQHTESLGAQALETRCQRDRNRTVPVLSFPLAEVARRLRPGVVVELVQVDAQGFDLQVVESLGAELSRVKRLQLECQDVEDPSQLLYVGAATCKQQQAWLAQRGFKLTGCSENNPKVSEFHCKYEGPLTWNTAW